MYRSLVDHMGVIDMVKIFILVISTNAIFVGFTLANDRMEFIEIGKYNQLTMIFVSITESFLLVGVRYLRRIYRVVYQSSDKNINTLVIGAGQGGKLVYDEITNNKKMKNSIKVFLDDDKDKVGHKFLGKPVEGPH